MAFFRNLGVNLRNCLCDVPRYASAQFLDFLDLAEKFSFMDWKLTQCPSDGARPSWMGTSYHCYLNRYVKFFVLPRLVISKDTGDPDLSS